MSSPDLNTRIDRPVTEKARLPLVVDALEGKKLRLEAASFPSWTLNQRQLCDLEMLLNGGFAPLKGFLCQEDYESVLHKLCLKDSSPWPIPIVLDISENFAESLSLGDRIALRDEEGLLIASLTIEDLWRPDFAKEGELVYGTQSLFHYGVHYLHQRSNPVYVGGKICGVELPQHFDFPQLRLDAPSARRRFMEWGWDRVVAFQTRNPMHRAHFELTKRAAEKVGGHLLIHPVVGQSKTGDVEAHTRVRCYQALMSRYPEGLASLGLLPLSMRMAGPREALLHGLIRKNYGCTHMIVGRDHAGPGSAPTGEPFYSPYAAQELFAAHEERMGIKMVPFENVVYSKSRQVFLPQGEVEESQDCLHLSGTELRKCLAEGKKIPPWFTFPEVAKELENAYPKKSERGLVLFFTGLSGAGKSTLAKGLAERLQALGRGPLTLLDGDVCRKLLSSELGFSEEHRRLNVLRLAFVAAEIAKSRGTVICAPIAPYDAVRKEARLMIPSEANFALIHVATPLETCEGRDRKGLYAKARAGEINNFTGISDRYEEPEDAELVLDTSNISPEDGVEAILAYLKDAELLDKRHSSNEKLVT